MSRGARRKGYLNAMQRAMKGDRRLDMMCILRDLQEEEQKEKKRKRRAAKRVARREQERKDDQNKEI